MTDHLAHADLVLLLADLLRRPSDWPATEDRPSGPELTALAERTGTDRDLLRETGELWCSTDPAETADEYSRLFDGSQACPPNETIYIRRDKGAILADISGFYRAFGFELSGEFGDKHDHILVELQFTALLLVLIHRADNDERREIATNALTAFLRDHLGSWMISFASRLGEAARSPFYAATAQTANSTWNALRAAYDLGDLEASPDLPVLESTGTPYECGMCDEGARLE